MVHGKAPGSDHPFTTTLAAIADKIHLALHIFTKLNHVKALGGFKDLHSLPDPDSAGMAMADQGCTRDIQGHANILGRVATTADSLHLFPAVTAADADGFRRANGLCCKFVIQHLQPAAFGNL
jgi:hypothetical protein